MRNLYKTLIESKMRNDIGDVRENSQANPLRKGKKSYIKKGICNYGTIKMDEETHKVLDNARPKKIKKLL